MRNRYLTIGLAGLWATSLPAATADAVMSNDCGGDIAMAAEVESAYAASASALSAEAARSWNDGFRQMQASSRDAVMRARSAAAAQRDKDAADTYMSVLATAPTTIEALNNLAYLQATSNDPAVFNPRQALVN